MTSRNRGALTTRDFLPNRHYRNRMLGPLVLLCLWNAITAFVVKPLATLPPGKTTHLSAASISALPPSVSESPWLELERHGSIMLADAGEIVKNIALAVFGLGAVLALFTIVFSSVIIPKAAEQLEDQVREKYPQLWGEYSSQLREGETLVMRPDLMQSLGQKVQQMTMADFDNKQQQQAAAARAQQQDEAPEEKGKMDVFEDIGVANTRPPIRSPVVPNTDTSDVIDADIIED